MKADYSNNCKKQILSKSSLIFPKYTYKSQELISVISDNSVNINKSDRTIKLVRLILIGVMKKAG